MTVTRCWSRRHGAGPVDRPHPLSIAVRAGLRILDGLPILARHALEPALKAGTFEQAWGLTTPGSAMPVLGPFILEAYRPGRTLMLVRNPRYWRRDDAGRSLPQLDRIAFEIVADMNAEVLRLESGATDRSSATCGRKTMPR